MLDTTISNFIKEQFPEIYREEGPFLVEFMKQYYVWLETDETSPVWQTRNYLSNHDIDSTVDDYIVFFKEKYLKNIQLNTATNTNQLIKNSINLYRSKGTENAMKLFFDLIFSSPSEIYYPGEDIFKLSDAEWIIPQYIEVQSKQVNRLLVGRQVRGVYSGATAFIEKLVRRKVKNTYIEVFYISAVNGSFQTGEIIGLSNTDAEYPLSSFPKMLGSLTSLEVRDGGDGFKVGDVVDLESRTGAQGKAIVQELESITGIVNFTLLDGGWGYTSNSDIQTSNNVLILQNVNIRTSDNVSMHDRLTVVSQSLANVQWYANTVDIGVGDLIYNYYANGAIRGTSKILSAEFGNSNTSNYFLMNGLSGNSSPAVPGPYTYTKINPATNTAVGTFTVYNAGWVDRTATANVVGMSSNVYITAPGRANSYVQNEYVYQISSNNQVFMRAKVVGTAQINTTAFTLTLNDMEGLHLDNFPVLSESTNSVANITHASFDIGIINSTHNFVTMNGNKIDFLAANSLMTASVTQIPFGIGASVGFDTDLLNPELVMINPNYVRDHLDVTQQRNWVNSASYGAELNNASLFNPILGEALRFEPKTLGTIGRLRQANPGQGYSYAPFVRAVDPLIAPLHKQDFLLRIVSPTGVFKVGELITQSINGARGLVKFANTSVVRVRRLTYEDRWRAGNTAPHTIFGQVSGFQTFCKEVTYDIEGVAGDNAVIATKVTSSNSAVLSLKVADSGFNYSDGEEVKFISADLNRAGTALSSVDSQGKSLGYHKTTAGFLSSNKYLYDGDYYQDFSYEIRSPITIDRYADMLKNILHVSGTKAFAAILKNTNIESQTSKATSSITQGVSAPIESIPLTAVFEEIFGLYIRDENLGGDYILEQ